MARRFKLHVTELIPKEKKQYGFVLVYLIGDRSLFDFNYNRSLHNQREIAEQYTRALANWKLEKTLDDESAVREKNMNKMNEHILKSSKVHHFVFKLLTCYQ
jgi:hypothetical protein